MHLIILTQLFSNIDWRFPWSRGKTLALWSILRCSCPIAALDTFILIHFEFFWGLRGRRGSSLGQKWPFYLVLPHSWDLPFCIKLIELSKRYFCWLAESGGTWLKNYFYKVLFSKETSKFEFFQFPSFKLENKAWGVYPHPTRAPYTTPMPASVKV